MDPCTLINKVINEYNIVEATISLGSNKTKEYRTSYGIGSDAWGQDAGTLLYTFQVSNAIGVPNQPA